MSVDASFPEKPWQNTLVGSRKKLNAIFNDGYFSDLTITFPGKEIRYKAHKVILAMSSSVFERMLFGHMATTGSELELPDDNPQAFKIVLAHCYEVTIEPSDIEEALEVYMLADKYFLEELSRECSDYICNMLNSENIGKVLEFSAKFNFDSLKEACYEHVEYSPEILIFLSQEQLQIILESCIDLSELVFEKSWQYPVETLQEDNIIQILKSENCSKQGLTKFSGCVTGKVVSNICSVDFGKKSTKPPMYLSFTNLQQANEILSILNNIKYTGLVSFHLQCKVIPAGRLGKILYPLHDMAELFISNVDDNGIDWAVSAINSLKPLDESFGTILFPRSKLTLSGFKILLEKMEPVFSNVIYPNIHICSKQIPSKLYYEINEWMQFNFIQVVDVHIDLYNSNEYIPGWVTKKNN